MTAPARLRDPVSDTAAPPPLGDADLARVRSALSFEHAVPRRLAHRASVSEVLPTDTADVGGGRYLVAAQGPRSHLLFNDGADRFVDLLVLVETVRQGGTVVAHRFLDVPLELAFVLRSASLEVVDVDALRTALAPAEIVADLRLTDIATTGGVVSRMSAEAAVHVDGRLAARGSGAMIAVPLDAYRRIRPPSLKRVTEPTQQDVVPLAPGLVGRTNPRNVVVGVRETSSDDQTTELSLVVDPSHPHFFDHPQDHVPGTLMLEAVRQAAVVVASRVTGEAPGDLVVTSCTTSFHRYVELGRPATCRVTAGRPVLPLSGALRVPVEVEILQGGGPAAVASLHLCVSP
jgi:2-oxo-3-(phosphooxy)propyl 3-oxoalkanoate synthase